jgi:hypothetical protein
MSKSIRRLLSFLLAFQLIIPYSTFAAAVGEFSSVVGNVTQTRAKEVITPIAKSPVEMKDLIVTARSASATMVFSDDSKIMLSENTKLEIKEFLFKDKSRTGIFSLTIGKVTANIKKYIGGDNIFEVRSPTGIVGVRGTGFDFEEAVTPEKLGKATVACTEGSLNLSALGPAGEVVSTAVLEAGQMAVIIGGVITISAIGAAAAAALAAKMTETGAAGTAGGVGTGTGGTAAATGGGTTVAAVSASAGAATAASAGTAAAATGMSTAAIAGIAIGGAAVVGGAVAAGSGGGGGGSSGSSSSGGTTPTPDYSRYSGTAYISFPYTTCLPTPYTAKLTVTPSGASTLSDSSIDDCGTVWSGQFVGQVNTMTTSNARWYFNGVRYCTGTGTSTTTNSDENRATGSFRVDTPLGSCGGNIIITRIQQ